MNLTAEQLQELKIRERDMLECFVNICNKHDIRYFVQGGTLLGTVRHGGFIPWDDDVDVSLPRDEYERFLAVAEKELPEYYFLQTKDTDPEYPNNFAKIRDSRTTFVETSARNLKINHGAYIDIFPLDNYPSGKKAKVYELKKKLLTWRINKAFYIPTMSLISKIVTIITMILFPSLKGAINKREKLFKSVPPSDRVVNNSGAWLHKEIIPKEWVQNSIQMEFEGITVNVSDKYDEWLTYVYGNYMSLPPENERVGHHYVDLFDMNKSYTEYMNEVH